MSAPRYRNETPSYYDQKLQQTIDDQLSDQDQKETRRRLAFQRATTLRDQLAARGERGLPDVTPDMSDAELQNVALRLGRYAPPAQALSVQSSADAPTTRPGASGPPTPTPHALDLLTSPGASVPIVGTPGDVGAALRQAAGFHPNDPLLGIGQSSTAPASPIQPWWQQAGYSKDPGMSYAPPEVRAQMLAGSQPQRQPLPISKIAQQAAPLSDPLEPLGRMTVNSGETAYFNGKPVAPGGSVSGIDPRYSRGAANADKLPGTAIAQQLPANAPSYIGGEKGRFIGPDEQARIARIGADKASFASATAPAANPLSYAEQQAEILRRYPQVGVAGSEQNKLFVNAFNAGGRDENGALDLAHSLFKPRTPEQVAAAALPKQQAQGAIQAQAAALRQTPGERQALVQKGADNQAKLDAAGREVYDPNATAKNIGRSIGDTWEALSDENLSRTVGAPIGNAVKSLWDGLTGGASPTSTPAAPAPGAIPATPATPALGARPAAPAVKPLGTAPGSPADPGAKPAAPPDALGLLNPFTAPMTLGNAAAEAERRRRALLYPGGNA